MSKESHTFANQEKLNMGWILRNWGEAQNLIRPPKSLDEPVSSPSGDNDSMTRGELLPDPVSVEQEVLGKIGFENMIEPLPPKLKMIVRLKYDFGYTSSQVGNILGIQENSVRASLSKALKMLRETNSHQREERG